jgi:hypothetical protein
MMYYTDLRRSGIFGDYYQIAISNKTIDITHNLITLIHYYIYTCNLMTLIKFNRSKDLYQAQALRNLSALIEASSLVFLVSFHTLMSFVPSTTYSKAISLWDVVVLEHYKLLKTHMFALLHIKTLI